MTRVTTNTNGNSNTMLLASPTHNTNQSTTTAVKIGARNLLETSIKNGSHSLKLGCI
jgi:hypothetical protein